jgi:hypothetical protein
VGSIIEEDAGFQNASSGGMVTDTDTDIDFDSDTGTDNDEGSIDFE